MQYEFTVNGWPIYPEQDEDGYNDVLYVSSPIVIRVANILVGADNCNCSIDVQEYPYVDMEFGDPQKITKEEPTRYYETGYYAPGNYKLTLTNEKKDVKVEYSTDTKATKSWTAVPADGKIPLKGTSYTKIFLKVSYSGQDAEGEYTVTLAPWSETVTE